MSKSFVIRMVLWTVLMLYLVGDFFVFSGPLKQELRRMFPTDQAKEQQAMAEGICARVFNAPIYLSQVDRRVRENLWRSGRDPEKVSAKEMKMLRWVAMDDLIAEALLRIKVRVNIEQARVSEKEVDAELARFEKQFKDDASLKKAMVAQGIESKDELRLRMQARLEQEKYVISKIENSISVSDEEAMQWYQDHKKELTMPERRRVRHIFLPTLDHPSAVAKAKLAGYLAEIKSGKVAFEKVAKTVSEDPRSKNKGGDLGWVKKERLPGDFAATVFTIPLRSPTLFRTKIGWHIVEVMEIKGPELADFETMKAEIVTAISDSRRQEAIDQYKHQLRLLNHDNVDIYRKMLD